MSRSQVQHSTVHPHLPLVTMSGAQYVRHPGTVQYSTVQYSTPPPPPRHHVRRSVRAPPRYSTVQYSTVQYTPTSPSSPCPAPSTCATQVQYSTVQYSTPPPP